MQQSCTGAFLFGQIVRIVAFNTADGWSHDAADEIANEIANELIRRIDIEGDETPACLEDFLDRHTGWSAQLPLPGFVLLLCSSEAPLG
jgi:phage-related protein